MTYGRLLWGAIAAVVIIAAAVGYRFSRDTRTAEIAAPLATPPGITIQLTGNVPFTTVIGYDLRRNPAQELAYADAKGMSLYTFDQDTEPGKFACAGDCAKAWPPAIAPASAQSAGDWSVVARSDGGRQWAWRGRPLYTYVNDAKIGDSNGKAAAANGWHLAAFKPADGLALPTGIAVQEVGDADGQTLVTAKGLTLYAFGGDMKKDRQSCATGPCGDHWTPLAAPELANAVGDFTIVDRDDGIAQWAWRGRPLYTFSGDLQPGDANGIGIDALWRPALVVRYFMPFEATIRPSEQFGPILATPQGMTIYRREAYIYQLGGHGLRHGVPPRPLVGRNIGAKGCDAECLRLWRPLQPPPGALPSGYWEILTRDDGTRQWTYKGYALYTYAGDKKPGEMTGNDDYSILISEDPNKAAELPSRFTGAGGLVWMHADP